LKVFGLKIAKSDALIITDVQIDFLPGGALPVEGGNDVIPVLNSYAKTFSKAGAKIVASRDWHPPDHISFKEQGGPWPPHCIKNTEGAKFSPLLELPSDATIISKATNPMKEAYSVFDGTGLAKRLKSEGVNRVFIGGLATDYCVVNSVVDAAKMNFKTIVLIDASRGIEAKSGDIERAFETMKRNGAEMAVMSDFDEEFSK
jgi:nicotinamidase/pyrazinamidase